MIGVDFGEIDFDLTVADAADEEFKIGGLGVGCHCIWMFFEVANLKTRQKAELRRLMTEKEYVRSKVDVVGCDAQRWVKTSKRERSARKQNLS